MESQPTLTYPQLLLESVDSELESADSSADSNTDPLKTGVLVRAFILIFVFGSSRQSYRPVE